MNSAEHVQIQMSGFFSWYRVPCAVYYHAMRCTIVSHAVVHGAAASHAVYIHEN